MSDTRFLNGHYDLRIRVTDRAGSTWECCGEIIDRHSGRPNARVYGRGRTKLAAEEEAELEAQLWVRRRAGMAR